MNIKDELNNLKEIDVYSLVMFAMYKMTNLPEYSTISEMVYILDKEPFLKLCEYFGGMTVRIPTIDEVENYVYALSLYHRVNICHEDYGKVIAEITKKCSSTAEVKNAYESLCNVLNKYTFLPR